MGKINVKVSPNQVLVGDLLSIRVRGAATCTWARVAKIEPLDGGGIQAVTRTGRITTFKPGSTAKVRREASRLPDYVIQRQVSN